MITAVLFVTAKFWKPTKCLSVRDHFKWGVRGALPTEEDAMCTEGLEVRCPTRYWVRKQFHTWGSEHVQINSKWGVFWWRFQHYFSINDRILKIFAFMFLYSWVFYDIFENRKKKKKLTFQRQVFYIHTHTHSKKFRKHRKIQIEKTNQPLDYTVDTWTHTHTYMCSDTRIHVHTCM